MQLKRNSFARKCETTVHPVTWFLCKNIGLVNEKSVFIRMHPIFEERFIIRR